MNYNLFYFFIGIISGLLLPIVVFSLDNPKKYFKKQKTQPWYKIDSCEFSTDFNFKIEDNVDAVGITYAISTALMEKAKNMDFKVTRGDYSVRSTIYAVFTKRDEEN